VQERCARSTHRAEIERLGPRRELGDSREHRHWLSRLAALAPQVKGRGLRVLLGVPGDDVHVLANRLAELLLRSAGYEVLNLGVMVSTQETIAAARDYEPSAIVLSTVNGHAFPNCSELPRALLDAGVCAPVFIGGNLAVGRQSWSAVGAQFIDKGFAQVFAPTVGLPEGVVRITTQLLGLDATEIAPALVGGGRSL
jgi:methylaspartate mutase sigma subunit